MPPPSGPPEATRHLRRLGPLAGVLTGCDRARVLSVELLSTEEIVKRAPGAIDRYLGSFRVTAASALLGPELLSRVREALSDPVSYLGLEEGQGPRGRPVRFLVLEAGERALSLSLHLDEGFLVAGNTGPRGRAPVILRLSSEGSGTLAPLMRLPLQPVRD